MIDKTFQGAAVLLVLLFLLSSCGNSQLQQNHGVIVLQPLNNYDAGRMAFLQKEVSDFFQKPVIISRNKTIPSEWLNYEKGKRYNAAGIIRWLRSDLADSVIAVAALTHEDIYTNKKDRSGKIKKPESTYAVWGIFGLGYCPGKSCVTSDRRLATTDNQKFRKRIRTVLIHEIGHNLGLPHCREKQCIMNDANEKIQTVDQSGADYCGDCNRKIGRVPPVMQG